METGVACPVPGCRGPSATCARCGCWRRPCALCPVRCCRRDDAGLWLADVLGSLDLSAPAFRWPPEGPEPPSDLPPVVPVLGGRLDPPPRIRAAALRWDLVLSGRLWQDNLAKTRSRPPTAVAPRWLRGDPAATAGLPPGTPVVAWLCGPDEILEGLWTHQFHAGAWSALARCRFSAVVGPNYSVYGDHPRFEHRLNMARSILAAVRLRAAGAPAVPHLYVWTDDDARDAAAWIAANRPAAVAVNWQTFGPAPEWEAALARYAALRDLAPATTRWWFLGPSRPDRSRA